MSPEHFMIRDNISWTHTHSHTHTLKRTHTQHTHTMFVYINVIFRLLMWCYCSPILLRRYLPESEVTGHHFLCLDPQWDSDNAGWNFCLSLVLSGGVDTHASPDAFWYLGSRPAWLFGTIISWALLFMVRALYVTRSDNVISPDLTHSSWLGSKHQLTN